MFCFVLFGTEADFETGACCSPVFPRLIEKIPGADSMLMPPSVFPSTLKHMQLIEHE